MSQTFAVLDEQVLGLEIAVDEMAGDGSQALRQIGELRVFPQCGGVLTEEILHEIVEEILLLPAVELRVEGRHQVEILGRRA